MYTADQPTAALTNKMQAVATTSAISAALVTIVTALLNAYGIVLPPEVIAAGATLLTSGLSLLAGYFARNTEVVELEQE